MIRVTGIGVLALLLLMVLGTGCAGREKLPTIEEALPPGYREAAVPNELKDALGGGVGEEIVWMRCFDCDKNWDELKTYLSSTLGAHGFTDRTTDWMPVITKETGLETDVAQRVFRVYTSASGWGHIEVIDLSHLKTMGGSIKTGGDYVMVAGYDNLDHYR